MAYALAMGVLSVISQQVLFHGLDRLDETGHVAFGFPIADGMCLVGFAAYSTLVSRKPLTPLQLAGITLGVAGIVAFTL